MVLVLLLAVVISIVLILVLRGQAPRTPYQTHSASPIQRLGVRPEQGHPADVPGKVHAHADALKNLNRKDLELFCEKLIDHLGLTFRSIDHNSERQFHILTYLDQPILRGEIILCGYLAESDEVVNSSEVIGFSDMIKAERAMKGVFLTNGFFSEEVMKLTEGASMELIDLNQLANLMEEIAPELIPSLPASVH